MKKNSILLLTLCIPLFSFSQVGIDTVSPNATLDVNASPNVSTKIDGLIAPKLKATELRSKNSNYTSAQDGAIVFVYEGFSSANSDNKTANIKDIGYYYFDSTSGTSGQWMHFNTSNLEPWYNQANNSPASANTQNIYQLGKVAIGKTSVYSSGSTSATIDINGAMRAGGNHTGNVGSYSLSVGNGNEASGDNSVSFGNTNKSTGNSSISIGTSVNASGDYSFAGGNASKAQGAYSFAFGNDAQALANHGFALGVGTRSPSRSSATFGRFNLITSSPHANSMSQNYANDPIFQVGTGIDATNRMNIITAFYGYTPDVGMLPTYSGWLAIGSESNVTPSQATATDPNNPVNGERLRVYGSVYATKYKAEVGSAGGYADYVFQDYYKGSSTFKPSYKFNTLKDTEEFIIANGHLPGVTSYNQLQNTSDGKKVLDISELSIQSLEKIEELYLHTIEQQKQIDELKDIIKSQEIKISKLMSNN